MGIAYYTGIDTGLGITSAVTVNENSEVVSKKNWGTSWDRKFERARKLGPDCKRYRLYYDSMIDYLANNTIGTVIMEQATGYLLGAGTKVHVLRGTYLIALSMFVPYNKIYEPKPTSIKKAFTGFGKADKNKMMCTAHIRGFDTKSNHEADSFAMACMGVDGKLGNIKR